MPQLLDQYGQPIPPAAVARMREEVAGPTLAGVRPVISGHPADGMTPGRLAQIHRAAAQGDTLAYMELAEDIEERDLHYAGVLGTRKRQVSQLPVQVEAASDDAEHVKHAEFVRTWLKRGVLKSALFHVLDAVGKGFSVMEIDWESGPGGFLPRKLVYRPQRWFEPSRADGQTIMLRDLSPEAWHVGADPAAALDTGLVPLAAHKFVVHLHPSKSGNVARSGIARLASWAWMYKAFSLRDWAVFVQNYGSPFRLGRYGPDASREDRDVLWRAVSNIAGDLAAIVPKSMEVEFIETGNLEAGRELYERRCDWLDKQVSKAVLGQTATTDASPGSHAAGRTHRLVQEDIERSDAELLSATVTKQVVQLIVALNFPGTTEFPELRIGRPDETPLEVVIQAMQWLGPQGLTVEASELRDRLGFSDPAPDAEVVGGAPPPPPVAGVDPPHVSRSGMDPHDPRRAGSRDPRRAGSRDPSKVAGTARQAQLRDPVVPRVPRGRTRQPGGVDPELVDRLTRRMELDAAGALAGLTEQVRAAIEGGRDMGEIAARLAALELDATAFAEALERGIAVAYLTGQAALLDELQAE